MDWIVSQISLPVRILLIGAVVFLAAWFTVLRPKAADVPPLTTRPPRTATAATPQTGLGKAVDAPRRPRASAATTADRRRRRPRADDHRHARRQAAAPPWPRSRPTRSPSFQGRRRRAQGAQGARARRARRRRQAVAPAGRRRPLRPQRAQASQPLRRRGRSSSRSPLDKLSTYGPLVNDLDVNQSPSVVVIDRNLKGTVLTGYVDRIADQPGDRRRAPRQHRPGHHGRLPARGQRALRAPQDRARRAGRARRSAASKAADAA